MNDPQFWINFNPEINDKKPVLIGFDKEIAPHTQ